MSTPIHMCSASYVLQHLTDPSDQTASCDDWNAALTVEVSEFIELIAESGEFAARCCDISLEIMLQNRTKTFDTSPFLYLKTFPFQEDIAHPWRPFSSTKTFPVNQDLSYPWTPVSAAGHFTTFTFLKINLKHEGSVLHNWQLARAEKCRTSISNEFVKVVVAFCVGALLVPRAV